MNIFSVPFVGRVIKGIVVAFFASTILSVVAFKVVPVWFTPLMFIRAAEAIGDGHMPKMHHHWKPLHEITVNMPEAVMASEDARFMKHHGFDFDAIQKAAKHNRTAKTKHGASTISQQTAKNVFLWPGRSWVRKGLEMYFTVLIEFIWGKERIMEVYLNSIEMGNGIYGVEAVAQKHFGKSAATLSRRESALIAATLPNPRKFSSKEPSAYMLKRQRVIVREMNFVKWEGTAHKEANK